MNKANEARLNRGATAVDGLYRAVHAGGMGR